MPAVKSRIASSKTHGEFELTKNMEPGCAANPTGGDAVGDTLHGSIFLTNNTSISKLEREPPKSNPGTHENAARVLLVLMRARDLYANLCDELERTNQDDNRYCLLLSNCADDLDGFISGVVRLQEAADE
jgi:hypothetical protein